MLVRNGKYLGRSVIEVMYKDSDYVNQKTLPENEYGKQGIFLDMTDDISNRLERMPIHGKCDVCSEETQDLNLILKNNELKKCCAGCLAMDENHGPTISNYYDLLFSIKEKELFKKLLKQLCVYKGMKDDFRYRSYLDFMINKVMMYPV